MDVHGDLRLGQRLQRVVGQRQRFLDLAEHLEVPGRQIGPRHGAGVEHRPLLRQVLPGRQTCGIESLVDELLLGFGTEEGHASLD